MITRIAGLSALLALGAAPALGQTLAGGPAQAYLYDFPNFQGEGVNAQGDIPDLGRNNFRDKATSIRILSGRWEICSGTGFTGDCEVIESDVWDLETLNLNNQIASMRPVNLSYRTGDNRYDSGGLDPDPIDPAPYDPTPDPRYGGDPRYDNPAYPNYPTYPGNNPSYQTRPVLTLYRYERFEGPSADLDSSVEELDRARFDNQARSLRVDGGAWRICEDEDFRGRCTVVRDDVADLDQLGLGERVSSVELIQDGPETRFDRDPYDNGPYGQRDRLEGYKATFFTNPDISGYSAEQCLRGSQRGCEDAADAFCRTADYREAAWYARDIPRARVRDVLCVRD